MPKTIQEQLEEHRKRRERRVARASPQTLQQERSNLVRQARMKALGYEPESFIKKSLKGGGKVLGGIFDVLSRPVFSAAGATEEFLAGGEAKDIGGRALREMFSGVGGLKGEKKFFGDVIRRFYPEATGLQATAGGLAADILLDPLTYLGPGLFRKIGQTLIRAPGVKAAGAAVRASRPGQALGRAFIPDFGLKGLGEAGEEVRRLKEFYLRTRPAQEEVWLARSINDAIDGVSANDLRSMVRQLDNGVPVDSLPTRLQNSAKLFGDAFEEVERLDLVAGVLDPKSLIPGYGRTVFPGRPPNEGFLARLIGPIRATKQPFQKHKKFKTLAEREAAGVPTEFHPGALLSARGSESIRERATTEFQDQVLERIGTKIDAPIPWHQIPEGQSIYMPRGAMSLFPAESVPQRLLDQARKSGNEFIKLDLEDLNQIMGVKGATAYLLPDEVVKTLNSVNQIFFNDEATRGLLGSFDKVMNIWKAHATAVNPGFHFRNMYSNWFLSWIGGVSDPKTYITATKLQIAAREPGLRAAATDATGFLGKKLKGTKYTNQEVIDLARDTGVWNMGWLGADIPSQAGAELTSAGLSKAQRFGQSINPLSRRFAPLRAGRKGGTAIENNARLAVFVDQLQKGTTPELAAQHVKKFLFDYGDLTPFEQNVMKRIMPFYTWMRKNIPLQIEMLARQPHKYAAVAKAFGEIRASVMEDDRIPMENLPAWMQDLGAIQLPWRVVNEAMFLNPNLPFQDLNNLASMREMASGISPAIKIPIEQITNKNIFFDRPIEEFPGQTKTTPELELLSMLAGYDHPQAVPSRMAHIISNMSPFFRNVSQSAPVGVELARGGTPETFNVARLVANLSGVKVIPFSEERGRRDRAYAVRQALQDLGRKVREDEKLRERFRQ